MTIGELLKEYRLEKGLTQKQFADGVVSTSYYSKVEKNEHRITAEDLITILEHNDIPMWSFFRVLSQKGNFQHQYNVNLEAEVLDAYYHSDRKRLEQLRKDMENSPINEEKRLMVDGWLECLKDDNEKPNLALRKALKNKIFSLPNLNKEKLILFCNFMEFYDFNSNIMIAKKAINKLIDSNETEIQEALLAIIVNLLYLSIKQNNYHYTDYLLSSAEKLPLKPQFFLYKDLVQLYKQLIDYHFSQHQSDLKKCHLIVANIKLAGMTQYGAVLENILHRLANS